ncbi:MAG TPA: UDP-N-acetylglucosamine 2-epimerase (non-hydrolyzing) [Solirubrobacteraceae bacterium]
MTRDPTATTPTHPLPQLDPARGRMRVLAVIGTRPEAIKMYSPVRALRARPELFEVFLCSSGQHAELLADAIATFGLRLDEDLAVMRPAQSPADVLWAIGNWLSDLIRRTRPDLLLVQGDTATAMATALAGYFARVPVAHIEAGLRSHDNYAPWPEEGTRRMVDTVADIHFAPTEHAAENLLREGIDPSSVHVTGNTGIDALHWVLAQRHSQPAAAPERRRVVITCHRRESIPYGLEAVGRAVRKLAQLYPDVTFQFVCHPSPAVTQAVGAALGLGRPLNIEMIPPCDYATFVGMLAEAHLVITDSGGIQEEAPVLGTPVLVVSARTDRQEGISAGTAEMVGPESVRIVAAAAALLDDDERHAEMAEPHHAFGDGRAGERIAAVLARLAAGNPGEAVAYGDVAVG